VHYVACGMRPSEPGHSDVVAAAAARDQDVKTQPGVQYFGRQYLLGAPGAVAAAGAGGSNVPRVLDADWIAAESKVDAKSAEAALQLEAGDGDRTRTKSLENPCVPSRPFAWSLGEALQSGNSRRRRPGAMR